MVELRKQVPELKDGLFEREKGSSVRAEAKSLKDLVTKLES